MVCLFILLTVSFTEHRLFKENPYVLHSFLLHSRPEQVKGAFQRSNSFLGTMHTCGARKPRQAACSQFTLLCLLKRRLPAALLEASQIFGRTSKTLPGTASHAFQSRTQKGPYLKYIFILFEIIRPLFFSGRWPFYFLLLHKGKCLHSVRRLHTRVSAASH